MVRQSRLGLVVDFDGTISEIAPTPDESRVSPRCAEALERLVEVLALVAVVSGRSASELRDKVGLEGVVYVGNHGAEYLFGADLRVVPGADKHRGEITAAIDYLRSAVKVPGLVWQHKGLSASVHYRLASDAGQARRDLETALGSGPATPNLEVFWGKMVLELRARAGPDKGSAIRKMVKDRGLNGLIFAGDDTTDVDALRSLRELAADGGIRALGIAVVDSDSPQGLLEAADYRLDGVAGVEAFLGWLQNTAG